MIKCLPSLFFLFGAANATIRTMVYPADEYWYNNPADCCDMNAAYNHLTQECVGEVVSGAAGLENWV
jgi:hypothetical protein